MTSIGVCLFISLRDSHLKEHRVVHFKCSVCTIISCVVILPMPWYEYRCWRS